MMKIEFKFFRGFATLINGKPYKRNIIKNSYKNNNVPGNWIIVNQATADMLTSEFYENIYNQ